ncbi:selenocysteine lyase [Phaeocystidibacter marisrubri]|uniref:Aminotransferase class V-fold PLP-dependent enzyme n=2 Tax=Phaeocystidibacter marisrubri TaxID=1577780 RepID=A0A6L3ZJH2_9FLAO|nr:aminotransferase class V-fold PLP-dependent enzyme [Phaeocystidibacter marisrubri]GGH72584.1 selenocysteine lyase [Phaeocystidibacter marisrubri]
METVPMTTSTLEKHFAKFRENTLGSELSIEGPHGSKPLIYADWIASGRMYGPIEDKMREMGAFVANTHTETSYTGSSMTLAYAKARQIIKNHVNASKDDVLLCVGTGMTGAVLKFQRILGLKPGEKFMNRIELTEDEKPVVFLTHMEHHSNQVSWLETIADVVVVPCTNEGLICMDSWKKTLEDYAHRSWKIASITGASNVTGIETPYHEIAKLMHRHNGWCFVDFACSAPYVEMDMHPEDPEARLDAIFFSPHKFLGGPGSAGIVVFHNSLYKNKQPDHPGGGTVTYTNPWGEHLYIEDIEAREDGGTPGFLQTIRAALAVELKEQMGIENMMTREHEIIEYAMNRLGKHPRIQLLAGQHIERLGAVSLVIEGMHYNLAVRLLNDHFGVQTRGGCSCAGTYGHYLLNVDMETSHSIKEEILSGDISHRPGWVRVSFHPSMTNQDVEYICTAIEEVADKGDEWAKEYEYHPAHNEYVHKSYEYDVNDRVNQWFNL